VDTQQESLTWFIEHLNDKIEGHGKILKGEWNVVNDYGLMVHLLKGQVSDLETELEWGLLNKGAIVAACAEVAAFAFMIADNINKGVGE